MANVKGSSNIRNPIFGGKHSLLPPKCPSQSIPPSFANYMHSPVIGPKGIPKPREENPQHLRTASESFLVEEQPSWLDELLNEPDTPVRKGSHRRASSDSFTYVDMANASNLDFRNNNMISVPSRGSLDFDNQGDVQYSSFYTEPNFCVAPKSRAWNLNQMAHQNCIPLVADKVAQLSPPKEVDGVSSSVSEKQDQVELNLNDKKAVSERKDFSNAKPCSSDTDTKRAKQQFAQRSRVRKLQYIAELERTVQVLQAEGCEVTAQLEFVNQQNLILSMENKALKQRLDSLAQEHLIKHLEQEVLEREIARLQVLFQQQQLPPPTSHRRTSSNDLDSQFANLSLKYKDTTSGREPIAGPLRS